MPNLCRRLMRLFVSLLALSGLIGPCAAQQISESRERLTLNERVLLDAQADGFMSIAQIERAPNGGRFVVIACGYECTDNVGFLFNADGSGKRKLTGQWDRILQTKLEWSVDGRRLFYYRINSTGADPPANAPREGWVEVDLPSLRKRPAINRRLKSGVTYNVFNLSPGDGLNVRAAPGVNARLVGTLDPEATGLQVTGPARAVGAQRWVPISYRTPDNRTLTGWVNQSYLYEASKK